MQARPADRLAQLAATGMSGEFICVAAALEIHVFLQMGRLAWATDSKHPFAFGAHLQETAKIDVEAFRQLVEECRRARLPLGETLVAWGLASWDAVRASLSHQIRQAIALMEALPEAQTLFLERSYAAYDERLTFELETFLARPNAHDDLGPAESGRRSRPSLMDRPGLAQQLRDTIEGLTWVEILSGDCAVESAPATGASRVPDQLGRMLSDGADFVAIRSARGSMVGLSLPGVRRFVWCCLEADSTFGAVVSALWSITMTPHNIGNAGRPRRRSAIAWTKSEAASASCREISAFMERAPEVLGVLVLSGMPDAPAILGCGSAELDADSCLALARRRALNLTTWNVPAGQSDGDRLSSIGFYLRTMVTGEDGLWCFGAEVEPGSGETLWLFTDRRVSQGLGWAYIAALTRALSSPMLRLGL